MFMYGEPMLAGRRGRDAPGDLQGLVPSTDAADTFGIA